MMFTTLAILKDVLFICGKIDLTNALRLKEYELMLSEICINSLNAKVFNFRV